MHLVVLALTSLAFASDGRRLRIMGEQRCDSSQDCMSADAAAFEHFQSNLQVGSLNPRRALEKLLLMLNPSVGFARSAWHVGTNQLRKQSRHHSVKMVGVEGDSRHPWQSAALVSGRPCGQCGSLAPEDSGTFNDIGVFYCKECWDFRELARKQRCEIACSRGLAATEDRAVQKDAAPFLFAKAELAIRKQSINALKAYLDMLPELCAHRGPGARTLLHIAASIGSVEITRLLMDTFASTYGEHVEILQAPELFADQHGISPGEYAFINGHQEVFDILVDAASSRQRPSNYCGEQNEAYVKQKLKYEDDILVTENGGGVMMGWEEPLMKVHARLIAPTPGLSVLNVGFGLGLVDGFLQERMPGKHTICEAHPDVYAEMCKRGWPQKEGVNIIRGRWEDVIEDIVASGPYDGVFFDTYNEAYGDQLNWFKILPRLLKPGARFSFFNGLSDNNIFAQAISCRVAQIDLASLGLACMYEPVEIGALSDGTWTKVINRYWNLETYYTPIAVMLPGQGADTKVSVPKENVRASAVHVSDPVGKVLDDKVALAEKSAEKEGWTFNGRLLPSGR